MKIITWVGEIRIVFVLRCCSNIVPSVVNNLFFSISYTIVGCARAHSPTYKRYFDHILLQQPTLISPPCRSCSCSPTDPILLSCLYKNSFKIPHMGEVTWYLSLWIWLIFCHVRLWIQPLFLEQCDLILLCDRIVCFSFASVAVVKSLAGAP